MKIIIQYNSLTEAMDQSTFAESMLSWHKVTRMTRHGAMNGRINTISTSGQDVTEGPDSPCFV